MKTLYLIIILLLLSCSTEPNVTTDDNAILNSILELGEYPYIDCIDLPDSVCVWDKGRITLLNLFDYNLEGTIPKSIGDLSELKILGLKSNKLNGNIPESIGYLSKLIQLNLSNNSLVGQIPTSLGDLKNLIRLDLSNNLMEGEIPSNLSTLTALLFFNISSNNFEGSINKDLCEIQDLNISNNKLCTSHPYCIDTPQLLGFQDCTCNNNEKYLNGYCYSINDLNVLDTIIYKATNLNPSLDTDSSGTIEPLELGKQIWYANRLKELDCYWEEDSCNISSNILNNISELDSLKYLDVQNNSITGEWPETITNLTNLKYINISNNQITGTISNEICKADTSIEIIINNNSICPCYPNCIKSFENQNIDSCNSCNEGFELVCDNISDSLLSIVPENSLCFKTSHINILQSLINNSLAELPDSLDITLDSNDDGIIHPLELGFQHWENGYLEYLDVRNIGLSGNIPNEIDSLSSLYILNIRDNYLSGLIPESICNISSLNWLPNEGTSSYILNNRLCPPYPECINTFVSPQDTSNCN